MTKDFHMIEELAKNLVNLKKEFAKIYDDHQDYYQRNPIRYNFYRFSCGRDRRLVELWGENAAH